MQAPDKAWVYPKPVSLMTHEELCRDYLNIEPDPDEVAACQAAEERWHQEHPWIRRRAEACANEKMQNASATPGRKGASTGHLDDLLKEICHSDWLSLWKAGELVSSEYKVDRWGRAYNNRTRDIIPLSEYISRCHADGFTIVALNI